MNDSGSSFQSRPACLYHHAVCMGPECQWLRTKSLSLGVKSLISHALLTETLTPHSFHTGKNVFFLKKKIGMAYSSTGSSWEAASSLLSLPPTPSPASSGAGPGGGATSFGILWSKHRLRPCSWSTKICHHLTRRLRTPEGHVLGSSVHFLLPCILKDSCMAVMDRDGAKSPILWALPCLVDDLMIPSDLDDTMAQCLIFQQWYPVSLDFICPKLHPRSRLSAHFHCYPLKSQQNSDLALTWLCRTGFTYGLHSTHPCAPMFELW